MAFCVHIRDDALNDALRINDERGTDNAFDDAAKEKFLTEDIVIVADLQIGVGKQWKRQIKLPGVFRMRTFVVATYTDHRHVALPEQFHLVAETASLRGAGRGIVFRIKKENKRLAPEISGAQAVPILIFCTKIRSFISRLQPCSVFHKGLLHPCYYSSSSAPRRLSFDELSLPDEKRSINEEVVSLIKSETFSFALLNVVVTLLMKLSSCFFGAGLRGAGLRGAGLRGAGLRGAAFLTAFLTAFFTAFLAGAALRATFLTAFFAAFFTAFFADFAAFLTAFFAAFLGAAFFAAFLAAFLGAAFFADFLAAFFADFFAALAGAFFAAFFAVFLALVFFAILVLI